MEEEKSHIDQLTGHVKEYVETRIDLVKLEAAERVSSAASSIVLYIAFSIVGIFALAFISAGGAWLIAHYTANAAIGFFSVAGFYIVVGLIIYWQKDNWIKTPIINGVIKAFTHDK
jgi:hypothetical protein